MMQRLQDLDLTKSCHRHALLLIVHENTLQSNRMSLGHVYRLMNLSAKR